MTETVIRLLIVDDHTLFREGLLAIFLAVSDIEVVGEASSGAEAVEKAQHANPYVILMDIQNVSRPLINSRFGARMLRSTLGILPQSDKGILDKPEEMQIMVESTRERLRPGGAGATDERNYHGMS